MTANSNHKNKIGKLKFNVFSFINNIKNNTISEADAKQKLDALNKIKKEEIKNKRLIASQNILLKLFDELIKAIYCVKKESNNNNSDNKNNVSENENDNDNENENGNENDNDNHSDNVDDDNDDDDDDHDEKYYIIKQLNNYFKTTDETKSFEEQIENIKKRDFLDEYWHMGYDHDDKELNLKIFKAKATYILYDLDQQLFKKIFAHTFAALADKLINTTKKEEKQILIKDIKENRDKIYEQDDFSNFVIKPGYKRGDLLDAVKIIINGNEVLSLDYYNND